MNRWKKSCQFPLFRPWKRPRRMPLTWIIRKSTPSLSLLLLCSPWSLETSDIMPLSSRHEALVWLVWIGQLNLFQPEWKHESHSYLVMLNYPLIWAQRNRCLDSHHLQFVCEHMLSDLSDLVSTWIKRKSCSRCWRVQVYLCRWILGQYLLTVMQPLWFKLSLVLGLSCRNKLFSLPLGVSVSAAFLFAPWHWKFSLCLSVQFPALWEAVSVWGWLEVLVAPSERFVSLADWSTQCRIFFLVCLMFDHFWVSHLCEGSW